MDPSTKAEEAPTPEKEPTPPDNKATESEVISENVSSKASQHSEYASVDSEDNYSDNEESRQRHSGDSGHSGSESESAILEREEGDGQESAPSKRVDDDQDKTNPQYIPKRGTFYEHDDRTADDGEAPEEAEAEKADKDGKKKVWSDKKEKWSHDKFNDNEQAPKSKQELVSIYGYDIRNEDGPPRARRRRRYGRGPNKYTRNWEDETAYNKPPLTNKRKSGPRKPREGEDDEEDCESYGSEPQNQQEFKPKPRSPPRRSENVEPHQHPNLPNRQDTHRQDRQDHQSQEYTPRYSGGPFGDRQKHQRVGTGRILKPNREREFKETDYRGFTKPRQFRNSRPDIQNSPRNDKRNDRDDYVQSQNFNNKNMQDIEKEMGKLSIPDGGSYKGKHPNNNQNRQTSIPPRMQEQKGKKRYTNTHQKSLPETVNPPINMPPHSNYSFDYPQQNQSQPQGIMQQPHQGANIHPPTQMPQIPPPPLTSLTQVPVTSTQIMPPGPGQYPGSFPPPAPFMQPAVPPPAFLPPQNPPLINYVQNQQPYPQPSYQEFPQQFNAVPQSGEMFAAGITYYNPQQQPAQRAAPLKRPKAAIPIIAPPAEPRGRGRANQEMSLPPGSVEMQHMEQPSGPIEDTYEDASLAVQQ